MEELRKQIKKAKRVYICGNGGSSATAEHFTNDLFSKGVKAVCLNSNTSIMTMIGNDFGYEYVFSKQVELFAEAGDLLIVISASGNSPNILEALEVAPCTTFAILGMGGGKARDLADYYYITPSDDYGSIENEHMIIVHLIKDIL